MPQAFPWVPSEDRDGQPFCARDGADPEWWCEAEMVKGEKNTRADRNLENLRAKIMCYECPLLVQCRSSAWDEPGHVWGGLDVHERYDARSGKPVPYKRHTSPQKGVAWGEKYPENLEKVRQMLFQGDTTVAIAATLDLSLSTVRLYMGKLLDIARTRRERQAAWGSPAEPFSEPTTKRQYLYGLEGSTDCQAEPA